MTHDYMHEAYGHYTQRNGVDFREGAYKCLPDNGMQFMRQRMKDMGFKLFQDFKHKDGHETRWWFKDVKTWEARTPGIEKLGYSACEALQVT